MEQRQKSMAKSPLYFGKILERTGKRAGLILADQPFIYSLAHWDHQFDGRKLAVRRGRGLHLRLCMRGVMYHVRLAGPSTLRVHTCPVCGYGSCVLTGRFLCIPIFRVGLGTLSSLPFDNRGLRTRSGVSGRVEVNFVIMIFPGNNGHSTYIPVRPLARCYYLVS